MNINDNQLVNDAFELIKKRFSKRNYIKKEIEADKLTQIESFLLSDELKPPFQTEIKFHIIHKPSQNQQKIKLGTYGFISGADYFMVGTVKNSPRNFEDYGYAFEKIILFLSSLGLGTCWLGGTFSRTNFGQAIEIAEKEIIPAISPFGYATEKNSFKESLIRWGASSSTRKSWEQLFFNKDFDLSLSKIASGKFTDALEAVRLAPSASNKQPWRIIKHDDNFHFFLQRTKNYQNTIKEADLQRIDMGIAMCHFELICRNKGINGAWKDLGFKADAFDNLDYRFSWISDI